MNREPYITCPICGATSFSPMDVLHRYCGNCHRFHEDMSVGEIQRATGDRFAWERFTRSRLGKLITWWTGIRG